MPELLELPELPELETLDSPDAPAVCTTGSSTKKQRLQYSYIGVEEYIVHSDSKYSICLTISFGGPGNTSLQVSGGIDGGIPCTQHVDEFLIDLGVWVFQFNQIQYMAIVASDFIVPIIVQLIDPEI